jgi:cephalosporin hydroxylase
MDRRVAPSTIVLGSLVVILGGLNLVQLFHAPASTAPTAAGPLSPAGATAESPPKQSSAGSHGEAITDDEIIRRFESISYKQQFGYWFDPVQGGLPHVQGKGGHGTPSKWMGVVTAQNPFDAWIQQEIIAEVKPDFIVETGTYFGGSAILWAMILAQVNPEGRVVTCDIDDKCELARTVPIFREKVDFLKGGSTDPKIVDEIKKRVQGKQVLVILDSDHHKKHVEAEIAAYAPLVSVGSYLIVQDTNFNGHPKLGIKELDQFGSGPYEAVEDFLVIDKRFEPDRSRERFLFTINPKGYLKRVR